ncbi:MAG: hypothetical protein ABIE22_03665 [archaeon]
MKTLDMQVIRQLNLFEKICRVRTNNCFLYNNFLVFAVPSFQVSKAIGEEGRNIKKLVEILGKKVKVVALPNGERGVKEFVLSIIHPLTFKDLKIEETRVVIEAGKKNKAALIGRGRRRETELSEILKFYFQKGLKIV